MSNSILIIDPNMTHLLQGKNCRETKNGYIATEEDDSNVFARSMHGKCFRMVHWLDTCSFRRGYSVDHIDWNPKNNRRCNLRNIPMLVNCMRKKRYGFLRGVSKTSSGKYTSRYSRTHIGTYDTVEAAATAYNQVLHHVYALFGCLEWYDEIKNPMVGVHPVIEIEVGVLESAAARNKSGRVQPMYADFWKESHPVDLIDTGIPGHFIVHNVDRPISCVRCGMHMQTKRNTSWDAAHEVFFKCDTCLFREA